MENSRWKWFWLFTSTALFCLFAHRNWYIPDSDYVAYFNAGTRALQGANLYVNEATPFKYLPVTAWTFVPFLLFPFAISKFVFFLTSFWIGFLAYRQVHRAHGNWVTLGLLVSLLRFHNYDFLNCQVNHLLLGLLLPYLTWRRTRPALAGFFFACFASFKVMPLLILGPLFFMKRYREVIWAVCWFTLLSLIPALTFKDGLGSYLHWYGLLKDTTDYPPSSQIFQSIQAALWFALKSWIPDVHQFGFLMNGVQALLLGACLLRASQAKTEFEQRAVVLAGLVISIVASPLAWVHNYLLLFPVLVFFFEQKRIRLLGVSFFLMSALPGALALFSDAWSHRIYSLLIGTLILFFALLKVKSPDTERVTGL